MTQRRAPGTGHWVQAVPREHLIACLLGIAFFACLAQGARLTSVPITITQPDGEVLELFASGDEFYNWVHDENGYTIVRDSVTGFAEYAELIGGDLVASGYRVGSVDPASIGLKPGLNLPPGRIREIVQGFQAPGGPLAPLPGPQPAPQTGTINNLVVFIRFSDEPEFLDAISTYDGMFNTSSDSMDAYFQEASYGALSISTTFYPTPGVTVVSYQNAHPRAYYQPYDAATNPDGYQGGDNGSERREREHTLLANAVDAISAEVPAGLDLDGDGDGRVDNVCFIVYGSPGAWASLLWPHKWSLYSETVSIHGKRVYTYNFQLQTVTDVSVLCHEMFHSLGAPDLYRYYDRTITPVGRWDLMASDNAQHMGAYMKYEYGGWIATIPEITPDGSLHTLNPLTSSTGQCYKIASNNSPTEFFVVEYRADTGTFESGVPGPGLIVTRINTSAYGNANGPPDEVYVYRPGGTDPTTNGDIWSAYYSSDVGRTAIDDTTNPSSFLSDGSPGGLSIYDIGSAGATISFRLGAPEIDVQRPATTSIADGATDYVGSQPAGVPATIDYTIENTGISPLSITDVTGSNLVDCSGFTVDTPLPLSVADGTSETLSVSITPTTSDPFSFDMEIVSNDADENPYDITVVGASAPDIDVAPASLTIVLPPDDTGSTSLSIDNFGGADLAWTISVQNVSPSPGPTGPMASGGPDSHGYEWADSEEPDGPTYEWIDITGSGTPLGLGDESSAEVALPFPFEFYGDSKTSVHVVSNGYLVFGSSVIDYNNTSIPNATEPNDLVAPYWDDLDPSAGGEIYTLSELGRFVVSWVGVPRWEDGGSNTFQAILYPDGRILCQYESMGNGGPVDSATVGIENSDGSDGLQVAYDEAYVKDGLAVQIELPTWIEVTPRAGKTSGGGSTPISVDLDATGLSEGSVMTCDIVIWSNDPDEPSVTVPVTLNVSSPPADTPAVFRVEPNGTVLADATVHAASIETGAADIAEWVPVSEPVMPGSVVELDPLHPGSYRLSSAFCAPSIAGVIATEPGMILGQAAPFDQKALLALLGIVPVRVIGEGGPILPGDLLIASSKPGYAMRWNGLGSCPCALVGKALEPMTDAEGLILVLLTSH